VRSKQYIALLRGDWKDRQTTSRPAAGSTSHKTPVTATLTKKAIPMEVTIDQPLTVESCGVTKDATTVFK